MSTRTYTVDGMTCSCCSGKVSTAVSEVAGVQNVEVDTKTGELTVTGKDHVDDTSIRDAITDIGYQVSSGASNNVG